MNISDLSLIRLVVLFACWIVKNFEHLGEGQLQHSDTALNTWLWRHPGRAEAELGTGRV